MAKTQQDRLDEASEDLMAAAADFVIENEARIRKADGWARRDEVLEALRAFKTARSVVERLKRAK